MLKGKTYIRSMSGLVEWLFTSVNKTAYHTRVSSEVLSGGIQTRTYLRIVRKQKKLHLVRGFYDSAKGPKSIFSYTYHRFFQFFCPPQGLLTRCKDKTWSNSVKPPKLPQSQFCTIMLVVQWTKLFYNLEVSLMDFYVTNFQWRLWSCWNYSNFGECNNVAS